MTQEQAADLLAQQIAEMAEATLADHPEQAPEIVGWLERLAAGEATFEPEDLKHPSRVADKLAATSPFLTADRLRVQEWANRRDRGPEWVQEAESLLSKEN